MEKRKHRGTEGTRPIQKKSTREFHKENVQSDLGGPGFATLPSRNNALGDRRNEMLRAAQNRDQQQLRWLVDQTLREYSTSSNLAGKLDEVFALHLVSWIGSLNDLVETLLKAGANPFVKDISGDSAIHYAVRSCNTKLLKFYYGKYQNQIFTLLNHKSYNLVLTAAAETPDDRPYDILPMLEWLYLLGCSLESQDITGKTPLLHAAQRGSVILVQWFLSRCANLAHRDHMGRTALHLCCTNGDDEVALILCEKGAVSFIHVKSNDDPAVDTPLKICWNRGHYYLGFSFRVWEIQKALIGSCTIFKNSYAWYYQILNFWNLLLFTFASRRLFLFDKYSYYPYVLTWASLWALSSLCWFAAFFANPGFTKRIVIPSQSARCSADFKRDLNAKWMSLENSRAPALEKLYGIEREQTKIGYELCMLNADYGIAVHDGHIPSFVERKYNDCAEQLQRYRNETNRLKPLIAEARMQNVSQIYRDGVIGEGMTKKLCISCRTVKPFRAHHCSDCAHCVHRFDHHCIWLDNCVGKNNQRAFYLFLFFLTNALLFQWVFSGIFVSAIVKHTSNDDNILKSLLLEPILYCLVANSILNLLWFGFVSYLFIRTSKAMITNLTFYEFLKKSQNLQINLTFKNNELHVKNDN
eukprot:GHVP01038948.1.p1 GENE.GHVP01038948.1~~GHVP01038948.1.p1  ORF type:complete len:640 (+),score=54.48 GHVP01038948.1:119-2038(+)